MWYNGEDNPEITAALEEERGSSLSKKNSPRAKRGKAYTPTIKQILSYILQDIIHPPIRYGSSQWVAAVEENGIYAISKLNS